TQLSIMLQTSSLFEVLSIPELIDAIQNFLTPHDLVQCSAVSKVFHAFFNPFIWETISIKTHQQHTAFTTVPEVQDALISNARHIRAIYLRSCKSLEPFLHIDPDHLKSLHILAFPWITQSGDKPPSAASHVHLQLQEQSVEDYFYSPASCVYDLHSQNQLSLAKRRVLYGGIDKVTGQKDWIRAKGMFPGQELAVDRLFRFLRDAQETRQKQDEEIKQNARQRAAQLAAVGASNKPSFSPSSTLTSAGSSQTNSIPSISAVQLTAHQQHQLLLQFQQQQHLNQTQVQITPSPMQSPQQIHQQTQTTVQSQSHALQQQHAQMILLQQQHQAQQQAQQQALLQHQAQPQASLQTQLLTQQYIQQAYNTLHHQVLQQQSRQASQHGLQYHSLQVGIPHIILAAHQNLALVTAQTAWQMQQLTSHEINDNVYRQQRAQQRIYQVQRVFHQTGYEALLTQQTSILQAQRIFHEQNPQNSSDLVHHLELQAHNRSLNLASDMYSKLHNIVEKKITIPYQGRILVQRLADQFMTTLVNLQQYQLRMTQSVPVQQLQQTQQALDQTNQSTLLEAVERLHTYIVFYPKIQSHLNDIASLSAKPWYIDNTEDEQWLVQFMSRFSNLKAFGSNGLLLFNKDVLGSMGPLWPNLRVLSLTIFKHIDNLALNRHHELSILLERCPPKLESIQLYFSEKEIDTYSDYHESMLNSINSELLAPPVSREILTLRHALIEGQIGGLTQNTQDHDPWINFLCRCPNLQSLSLGGCSPNTIRHIAAKAKDHWPLLQEFAAYPIVDSRHVAIVSQTDSALAALLSTIRREPESNHDGNTLTGLSSELQKHDGLRKVRLDRFTFTSQSLTIQSLFRMSKTLTHLSFRDCQFSGGLPSEVLCRLLRAFERLEVVDFLPSGSYSGSTLMTVNAEHFIKFFSLKEPWRSTDTLQVMRMAIGEVRHRPDPIPIALPQFLNQSFNNSVPSVSPEQLPLVSLSTGTSSSQPSVSVQSPLEVLYKLQREVCQILGSFVALRELSLGVHAKDDQLCSLIPSFFQQVTGLEMMIESGLNLLIGLKQLRILNVSRMDHRIGVAELRWMKEHWPHIHSVLGLLKVENIDYQLVQALRNQGSQEELNRVIAEEKEQRDEIIENEKLIVKWIKENFSWLNYT
ncbi:hypothetical protein FBU30_000746, partial [Linnemannia zychae]